MAQLKIQPVPAAIPARPTNYGSGDFLIDVYGKEEDGVYTKDGKQWFNIPPSRDAGEVCSNWIIDSIRISDPSAGSVANYSAVNEFKLLSIGCTFSTDNNAANRYVYFQLKDDSNNSLIVSRSSSAQAENNTLSYFFGFGLKNHFIVNEFCIHLPEVYLLKGYVINVGSNNFQDGDQFSNIFMNVLKPVVRYRFEVKGCKSFMIDAGSNTVKAYKIG